MSAYDAVASRLRRPLPADPALSELVRYAILAPNGHNTQPWRFVLRENGVRILPDFSRRTPVVDPDDHHLFVSLGCAAENFALAAKARFGPAEIAFDETDGGGVDVAFARTGGEESPLFRAIPARQSTKTDYDGSSVSSADLSALEEAARIEGVHVRLFTAKEDMERIAEFVAEGNDRQLDDPAFVQELMDNVRFNEREALERRDGLFGKCTGEPTLPPWLGKLILPLVMRKKSEAAKFRGQVLSSAGVAVFTAQKEDPEHWVRVGRSFERFALQATALGILHAHVNQPTEVVSLRPEFAAWLGAREKRPDLVIRFGHGRAMPPSLRRDIEDVIVEAA